MLGRSLLHRRLEDRVLGRDRQPLHLRADLPGLCRNGQATSLAQEDEQGLGLDQGAGPLDDQVEHTVDVGLAADGAGDVHRRLRLTQSLFRLGLVFAHRGVEAGVLDRDSGPGGERERGFLV